MSLVVPLVLSGSVAVSERILALDNITLGIDQSPLIYYPSCPTSIVMKLHCVLCCNFASPYIWLW